MTWTSLFQNMTIHRVTPQTKPVCVGVETLDGLVHSPFDATTAWISAIDGMSINGGRMYYSPQKHALRVEVVKDDIPNTGH